MKIKLDPGAYMPERAHDTDAGLDLRAREVKVVPAGGSAMFDTGVHVELPYFEFAQAKRTEMYGKVKEAYHRRLPTVGLLKSKSGLNVNHNITSDGVIDMGYTGSIRVKLYNNGKEDYPVYSGDKISQLVIVPVLTPNLELVIHLDKTERGSNGFGSTGR